MILIHPPVAKPSEPPAGLGKLSGALSAHGVRHTLVDANLEGLLHLLSRGVSPPSSDTWTVRASRNVPTHLEGLRDIRLYGNFARYQRAIADVNRLLRVSGGTSCRVSLSDYEETGLSAQRSGDLLRAAGRPEDNLFYPYFSMRLRGLMDGSRGSLVVGLSLNYLSQAICAFAMMGFVRRECPHAKIVLGGSLLTSWMANPRWKDPFGGLVDILVRGPGEEALLGEAGVQAPGQFLAPGYDGLPLGRYFSPGTILPYAASRGCYWRKCSFCPEKAEGADFSPTPRGLVTEDLKGLSSRYEPALIHLVDDALSPALMRGMIADPPGRPWYGFSRITPDLADIDFCKALKGSGCVMLKLGLESGDQAVLDSLDKGITLDLASAVLASLKEAKIATYVYLLFGTPAETPEAARKTTAYVASLHENIDFLNLAIFNLPINCPEADALDTRRFYEGDLSLYADFTHPSGWSRREVRTFLDREFRMHPAIRPILLRNPRSFGSNHAPFFRMASAPHAA